MNILFTPSDNNRNSGAFLCMVKLIELLESNYGHSVLVVLPSKGTGTELLEEVGIHYKLVPSYTWTRRIEGMNRPDRVVKDAIKAAITKRNATRIARIIRDEGIDLVHVNTTWGYVGALAALQADVPFVWHIREFLEEDQARAIRHRERGYALMARADRLVAISQSIYDKYEPVFGAKKLTLIFEGLDPAQYLQKDHEILTGEFVRFLLIGSGEGKGHRVAIRACLRLLTRGFSNFELVMVGRIPEAYRQSLEKMWADVPEAEGHFLLPGPTYDVSTWYRTSDVYLMCSRSEAFGRVTVEAMMGGCLVIGADSGGTHDLIQDGITGYFFQNGDEGALAERIEYVLSHRLKAREVARVGQAYMLEHMTAEVNAAHVNALYNEILSSLT